MRYRERLICLLAVAILVVGIPMTVLGGTAGSTVSVTLPDYKVMLNGTQVDNAYRKYPLVVYKGITYFPMTYGDCRFLGLETDWSAAEGLAVNKTEVSAGYHPELVQSRNRSAYSASIASFGIKVNGKALNNRAEPYPLLSFRNVTYFPMTWRFGVDEFGWDYRFDNVKGAAVLTINSSNRRVNEVLLPKDDRRPVDVSARVGGLCTAGGSYYYEGSHGKIYQASVDNPDQAKLVYQLPPLGYGDDSVYVNADLRSENERAVLSYHQGGGFMGSDHVIVLNPDGSKWESVTGGLVADYGDLKVEVNHFIPPGSGNMRLYKDRIEQRAIGSPEYLYGWNWRVDGEQAGGEVSRDIALVGDDIYVLAYHNPEEKGSTTGLYRVNIKTNDTARIGDLEVVNFIIREGMIYMKGKDENLYSVPVSADGDYRSAVVTKLSKDPIHSFDVLSGVVYYSTDQVDGQSLFWIGQDQNLNPGAVAISVKSSGKYMLCTFKETANAKYRIMVFDDKKNVVFRTADVPVNVQIEGDQLIYRERDSGKVFQVNLAD